MLGLGSYFKQGEPDVWAQIQKVRRCVSGCSLSRVAAAEQSSMCYLACLCCFLKMHLCCTHACVCPVCDKFKDVVDSYRRYVQIIVALHC